MKKTKLLIVTLVCAVMMMGVGYAWWTDAISLVGTANTGCMNVHFENKEGLPIAATSCYASAEFTNVENENITFRFDNLYPGALGVVDAMVINEGTVPVKLKNATINVTGDQALKNNLLAAAVYYKINANGNYVPGTYGWTAYSTIDQLANNLKDSSLKNIILYPGERIFFGVPDGEEGPYDLNNDNEKEECFIFYVNHDAGNDTQNNSVTFDLGMEWQQVVACPPSNPCN